MGVPGGEAPWRLLVPFRRRKGTARPGMRGNPPHCMGKTTMRPHCRKNKPPLRPAVTPRPGHKGQTLPICAVSIANAIVGKKVKSQKTLI